MEKIIILGSGGHAQSLIDVIERQGIYDIAGYIVNDSSGLDSKAVYPVIGCDNDLSLFYKDGIRNAAIGIGFLGKGTLRNKLYKNLKEIGYSLPVICDPSAIISKRVSVGEGTFIGKGAVVNAGAKIGKMCIINTGAIIEHGCQVGDYSHVAVGSVLCGDVCIGCETLVGANATVIQGRIVGDRCIVPAGEVIRKNVINEEL